MRFPAHPSWGAPVAGGGQSESALKELRPAAVALKLKLDEIQIQHHPKGLESAFQTAKQKQVARSW